MVVALGRVTPDQGWQVLKEVSQHTNIKLRNVADLILVWGRTGGMPPEIRAELADAGGTTFVRKWRGRGHPR